MIVSCKFDPVNLHIWLGNRIRVVRSFCDDADEESVEEVVKYTRLNHSHSEVCSMSLDILLYCW